MPQEKRYTVTLDLYVYAKDDYMARKRAWQVANELDKFDGRVQVTEIAETPFASFHSRKLENITNVS